MQSVDSPVEQQRTQVCRLAFSMLRGLTIELAGRMLARIGSEEAFFDASERTLGAVMGFSSKLFDSYYRRGLIQRAGRELDFVRSGGVEMLYYSEPGYPSRLLDCPDAPLMLFTAGSCRLDQCLTIGIVGTRHATPYGLEMTRRIVDDLAAVVDGKMCVISGLAYGIDIAAHTAALKAGIPTAGVLAHGLNTIYPAAHRQTAATIVHSGGLLLTDYCSDTAVHKGNFLARNRIVAGLSDCLLVVESAEKGGAMVTARIAFDYGRDVFALPGRVADRYSAGCNRLINRNTAALVTSAADIIDAMGWPVRAREATQGSIFPDMTADEQAVYDLLAESGEGFINTMAVRLGINIGRLTALLIEMEFKGLVTPCPGGRYRPAVP